MGAGYEWKCTACGYKIETSGPWEFYVDKKGNRKPYGHPSPMSREAKKSGVYGLSAAMYCPKCDRVEDSILVEFEAPQKDMLDVWSGRARVKQQYEHSVPTCTQCGGILYLALPEDEIKCPRCNKGTFEGGMVWVS